MAGFIGSPSMNFMPAALEDGRVRTPLGDAALIPQLRQTLERENVGRDVIVGIRPENFEDAALVQADERSQGITFQATIDVLESMGSDVYVYFTKGAEEQQLNVDQLAELAQDSGQADTGGSSETMTARLDATTQIREGHDAELWVDTRSMHIFDPRSGRNLSLGAEPAATAGPAS